MILVLMSTCIVFRVFAVGYNRWMLSRLVLLNVVVEDTGVYMCSINHNGKQLQFAAVVQVEGN